MAAPRPFTSALGPREAYAVAHAGFVPLRQVMGAAFFRTDGVVYTSSVYPYGRAPVRRRRGHTTSELPARAESLNRAREAAVGRMRDEAVACRADAVVGVRIHRGERDWVRGMVEYVATGTAVRAPRYEIRDPPLLCTLSGQDVAKLVAYGHWPVGIAGGSTVAYIATSLAQQRANPTRGQSPLQTRLTQRNRELRDWSVGFGEAYALAIERSQEERGGEDDPLAPPPLSINLPLS